MVGLDWIGKHLSDGKDFKPLARRAMAAAVGEVYYVDLAAGTDAGTGEDWDKAYLTTAYAYNQMEADGNDYAIVRGWKTETDTGVIHRLDVAQSHLIGHAGILNPYFPEKGSLYRSGAGDAPILRFESEFVEVAGFAINARQSSGTESSTVTKGFVEFGDYSDANAVDDGNKGYLHNCYLADWNQASDTTGITITGAHYFVIEDCTVDSVYGNIDTGIYCTGSDDSNPAHGVIKNFYARGGYGGALATAIGIRPSGSANELMNTIIDGVRHVRGTNMFNLRGAYGAYCQADRLVGDMTEANAITGGSTCDNRGDLWTNYKWSIGPDTYFRDNAYQNT